MGTLIFDIETVGEKWEDLDSVSQGTLLRWVKQTSRSEEEFIAGKNNVEQSLGFSPLTGFIVALGLYDLERGQGVVYYAAGGEVGDSKEDNFVFKSRSEQAMLAEFWEGAVSYDQFVTFNGRRFDVPFMLHRSAILGVKPTADLMSGRYLYQQRETKHIDLQDQMTFYGAMQRRPSLHLFCRAYGIESPKSAEASGDAVADLYWKKEFDVIAHYNRDDVVATTKLYQRWQNYLAPST